MNPAAETVREDTSRPGAGHEALVALAALDVSMDLESQGAALPVLRHVSLAARNEEFLCLIGPSGCGKSTLLAALSGLRTPSSGRILTHDRDTTGRVGHVALMPQRDLLLPWRSVLDNAAIPLELRGVPRNRAREEAASWFPRFGLQGFERSYPARLSGGMRQRAALLRTFLTGRDILLLDEPFGALDALTRADMQEWLLDIWTGLAKTIVLVTHDVDEAIYLADRVCVMSPRPGTIEREIDIPLPRPRNHDAIVTSAAFAELKRTILNALRGDARTGGNP
jgi:ABC-type nitrate/sulfonate/bicarbonate transport system ATPase subunit